MSTINCLLCDKYSQIQTSYKRFPGCRQTNVYKTLYSTRFLGNNSDENFKIVFSPLHLQHITISTTPYFHLTYLLFFFDQLSDRYILYFTPSSLLFYTYHPPHHLMESSLICYTPHTHSFMGQDIFIIEATNHSSSLLFFYQAL